MTASIHSVLAAGWIPFVIVIVLVLIFSSIYIKYYTSKRDSECSTTLCAILALSVTLMTTALIPVDVFLVSFMKSSDGTFSEWAKDNETRHSVEQSVLVGYYTMYGLITFCMFLLLPFMYFFYEEREDDVTCKSRCCGALKYSVVFLIVIFVLLLIGALVHTKKIPMKNQNSTDWEKLEALFDMESNWIENSLSFVISILSLIGMLALFTYTAYGMAILPIDLIRGSRNVRGEKMDVQSRRSDNRERIQAIKNKYSGGRSMSSRDASRVSDLEESEALMERQERHLEARDTCCQKCWLIFRPFAIVFGILLILVAVLVFLSLLLTNIDKTMHSLGPKLGYALPKATLPNPVDIVLVYCQKVFPLDYILFAALVLYLVISSMAGIRNIGIWFFCLRMYKIRPRRTRPQGILMMCMILMFIQLGINIILYELTPQYSSYGSQHFKVSNSTQVEECSTNQGEDECVITRMSLLLTRFFYKMWFFGAAYYWCTWSFLLFILIGFLVAVCKKSKSAIDGEVESDDFDDSDEELIQG
ncbi:probable lysosomal cobalamin transporter [Mercenaria mercenaria]|uniref:probable lysosomal cobalamin transporter n=1 Tax=Mercenaria mercenaria TaxID=6596 RepID=UPI00234F8801|nr:probable lysosomal cobalamin transporter [Mercenaria mercenaria]